VLVHASAAAWARIRVSGERKRSVRAAPGAFAPAGVRRGVNHVTARLITATRSGRELGSGYALRC
jgi:hypothetical protein